MMYRKFFSTHRAGLIIIDIMVGLALAALFAALLIESSFGIRDALRRAIDRADLIDEYDTRSQAGTLSKLQVGPTVPYGNERLQQIYATSSLRLSSVVSKKFDYLLDSAGTSLCSADFSHGIATGTPLSSIRIDKILLPVRTSLPLTDLIVRNSIAYVSADSSVVTDPDMFIIDMHDVANPIALSSIDTGPGIMAITLAGRRVFAAAASTAAQLHVIRLDSLNMPILEKKYQVPLPTPTTTPPLASAVFYDKGYLFLGTEKWNGDDFHVFRVFDAMDKSGLISTALSPTYHISGFKFGTKVTSIWSDSSTYQVYVATAGQKQFVTLNMEMPTVPFITSSLSPSGWSRQEGKVISLFEKALTLGRTSGGYDISTDKELFSGQSMSSLPYAQNIPGGVYGLVTDRSRIYVASRQVGLELQVFERGNAASSTSYMLPGSPQTMTCDGDRLYVLSSVSPEIYRVSLSSR